MTLSSPPQTPRLLIAIPTCHTYNYFDAGGGAHQNGDSTGRATAVRDTWYRTWLGTYAELIDLKFFYGLSADFTPSSPPLLRYTHPGDKPNPNDSVTLDVPDDYLHLGVKVQEIFQYALANNYDYVLKVDDDVFVWLDRLLDRFVPTDYLGFMAENVTGTYICGASYWVSRQAMEAVVAATWTLDDWAEDRWVGRVLAEAGITPTHDDRHRVCHCDICDKKWPTSDCTTMHVWPHINRMKELYGQ